MAHVLDQLAKCFRWHREDGGRIFVTEDGAYWKEGAAFETRKVQFARWEWIGEPPERPRPLTAEENARAYAEIIAKIAETRRSRRR